MDREKEADLQETIIYLVLFKLIDRKWELKIRSISDCTAEMISLLC